MKNLKEIKKELIENNNKILDGIILKIKLSQLKKELKEKSFKIKELKNKIKLNSKNINILNSKNIYKGNEQSNLYYLKKDIRLNYIIYSMLRGKNYTSIEKKVKKEKELSINNINYIINEIKLFLTKNI